MDHLDEILWNFGTIHSDVIVLMLDEIAMWRLRYLKEKGYDMESDIVKWFLCDTRSLLADKGHYDYSTETNINTPEGELAVAIGKLNENKQN